MFYVLTALRAELRVARTFRRRGPSRTSPRCSIWSRSARSPTSSASITPTGSSSTNGLRRIRAGRMQPGDPRAVRRRPSRPGPRDDLRPGLRRRTHGSTRPGAWRTCPSASPACLPTTMRPQSGSRASWIGSTANGAKSRRPCRNRRWRRSTPIVAGDAYTICIYRADWHQGVVGLVASRLKDRFHRPAVVFAPGADGELRGSGRTIRGFHLRDALDLVAKRSPGTITRFGGHAFAAGLTMPASALPRFAAAFERRRARMAVPGGVAAARGDGRRTRAATN